MTTGTLADAIELMAAITILYIGAGLLIFIVLYAGFFNWRKTSGGRSVMYFVGSLDLLIALAAFLNWLPDLLQEETKQLLRLEVYITIAVATTRMLYVLIRRWRTTGSVNIDVDLRRQDTGPLRQPKKEKT